MIITGEPRGARENDATARIRVGGGIERAPQGARTSAMRRKLPIGTVLRITGASVRQTAAGGLGAQRGALRLTSSARLAGSSA
jgi:hypothetical protein